MSKPEDRQAVSLEKATEPSSDNTVKHFIDDEYEALLSILDEDVEQPWPVHALPKPDESLDTLESVSITDEIAAPARKEDGSQVAKPKRRSLRSRIKSFFDPKIWPHALDSLPEHELQPKKLYIGLLSNVRKKDLIGYIDEWIADNNCNRSSCAYQIVPYMGGYAFEVHEGGAARGALQGILHNLEAEDEITVPSNDRYLRVAKKHDGFSVYLLNEFEEHKASACVEFKEPLSPVYKRNHGLMMAGVIGAVFSSAIFLTTWFMVYTLYNKDKVPVFTPVTVELPSQQINKIADIAKRDDAYLKSLVYANGKWKINLETVAVKKPAVPVSPVPPTAPASVPMPGSAANPPQAQIDRQLIELHSDLVKTLAEQKR